MTAFNVVRFRVKPGQDEAFLAAHRDLGVEGFSGARRFSMIKTGDGTYCVVGEWNNFDDIVNARPMMIGLLDNFRHMLEDLGSVGVTDPVSGEAVIDVGAPAPAAKARRSAGTKRKPASKARSTAARAGKPTKKKAAAKSSRKPAKKAAKRKTAKRKR
jgi:hypothetical protein